MNAIGDGEREGGDGSANERGEAGKPAELDDCGEEECPEKGNEHDGGGEVENGSRPAPRGVWGGGMGKKWIDEGGSQGFDREIEGAKNKDEGPGRGRARQEGGPAG